MPGKHVDQLCKRCNALQAALAVRSEPLCRDCFSRYIHSKVIKRMTAFQTRYAGPGQERKLLLPISMGISSVTLLHILDKHLQTQRQKTGRTGFSLHVLYIRSPDVEDLSHLYEKLQEACSTHMYSAAHLSDLFTNTADMTALLSSLPSASSLADVVDILRKRLMVKFASTNDCEAILLSQNTTTLAESILSASAKGRGYSLPHLISDGASPYSPNLQIFHPLRDVLRKELISYVPICCPSLMDSIDPKVFEPRKPIVNIKNMSIDALMGNYFEDVEETYPSVVSNVVRTAGKLVVPEGEESGIQNERCRLCLMVVGTERMGTGGWGGSEVHIEKEGKGELCYGCSRSLPVDLVGLLP